MNIADLVVEQLISVGVQHVFGVGGANIENVRCDPAAKTTHSRGPHQARARGGERGRGVREGSRRL